MGMCGSVFLSPLYAIDVYIAMRHGINCERRDAFHTQFFLYSLAVGDDGCEPDAQFVGDFLVDFALCYQRQHLTFSVGKYLLRVGKVFLRDMLTVWVAAVLQTEQLLDEHVLRHIDAETMKV